MLAWFSDTPPNNINVTIYLLKNHVAINSGCCNFWLLAHKMLYFMIKFPVIWKLKNLYNINKARILPILCNIYLCNIAHYCTIVSVGLKELGLLFKLRQISAHPIKSRFYQLHNVVKVKSLESNIQALPGIGLQEIKQSAICLYNINVIAAKSFCKFVT